MHTTYLSAWVSLGRVLREQQKNGEAVDALTTALQVDPGNVVAARLLADCYFDLGEKVEAIKKCPRTRSCKRRSTNSIASCGLPSRNLPRRNL